MGELGLGRGGRPEIVAGDDAVELLDIIGESAQQVVINAIKLRAALQTNVPIVITAPDSLTSLVSFLDDKGFSDPEGTKYHGKDDAGRDRVPVRIVSIERHAAEGSGHGREYLVTEIAEEGAENAVCYFDLEETLRLCAID